MKRVKRRIKRELTGQAWELSTFPKGCLDPSRLHFWGHSLQMIVHSGVRWVKIHSDWSVTIELSSGSRGKIPAVVMCTRDRRGAVSYIRAIVFGRDTDNVKIELDQYDRELRDAT